MNNKTLIGVLTLHFHTAKVRIPAKRHALLKQTNAFFSLLSALPLPKIVDSGEVISILGITQTAHTTTCLHAHTHTPKPEQQPRIKAEAAHSGTMHKSTIWSQSY